MLPITIPARMQAFAARLGLSELAIAVLLALLAVQTVRLEGFKLWPLSLEGWKPRALAAEKTVADIAIAQQLANERASAARQAKEEQYREIAERIDDNAKEQLDDAMAAAERFIAAGGVRTQADRSQRGRAGACGPRDGAGRAEAAGRAPELDAAAPEPVIPEGFVLVPAGDVRICTTNTVKAEAGRDLALQLEAASGD